MLRLALAILLSLAAPLAAQEKPPMRIVALNWALAESLLAIGVVPIGVADVMGYRTWVGRPELALDTPDVGLRTEPNLETIAALAPDLILASDQQRDLLPALGRIAEVWHVPGFSADQDNAATARAEFLALGTRLGRGAEARAALARSDARIEAAAARLHAHFGEPLPEVLPIRLLSPTTVRIHGANGMARAALAMMNLPHPDPGAPNRWGFRQRPVEDLARFDRAIVVNFTPFPARRALFGSALWSFMPFVQGGRFAETGPVWAFGGAVSLGYMAEAIAEGLLTIDPEALP
ncbi:iron-siderophore ABC transporter substrate-binding protein [Sulfitobacter aestuarii]|uniref:Iron-siderophore ABC transporter substrate-binding protein n=1 Tax=Sulfitobacter aestuarii TaxID=2161676 RepID=A0ABW5U7J0_9RHOB